MGNFQRCFILSLLCVIVASVSVTSANDQSCPPGSKGKHPKCICGDDLPYDEINRICATKINVNAVCPKGTTVQFGFSFLSRNEICLANQFCFVLLCRCK